MGVAYSRDVKILRRDVILTISGPVRRNAVRKKRPGIAVEFRF